MATKKYFIIDFDSTFTQVEALDELGELCLDGPSKEQVLHEIKHITDLGMSGSLTFRESLVKRLDLLKAHKNHLDPLVERLRAKVSKSFMRNREFLLEYKDDIYIVSNGFKDFIAPVVADYGIDPSHVFANTFEFDNDGFISGFDQKNILSQNNGKPTQIKALNLDGEIHVIGDGYTDYEIKSAGIASKFFAFTENVHRENVTEKADHITPTLDDFLFINKLSRKHSFPKNRIKVLLLENVHSKAAGIFEDEGYDVEIYPSGLDEEELCKKIVGVSVLGIRSKTQVTAKVLEKANRLMAIGAFCIGTNQIDLEACLSKGVAVFNAPYSNTRSVVELAIGNIIFLLRNLADTVGNMHAGQWNKSASNSNEIRGKKLGIVGYGNIGTQLSVLAESMGMVVYYYDTEEKLPLGNVKKCHSLLELLSKCDVVSLHVDGRPENKNLISSTELSTMKQGSILLNLSRGHVVDIEQLKANLESGHLRGASVDVFPEEPNSNDDEFVSELRGLKNTILTPHIGGSTQEAQENIAQFVPQIMIDFVNSGSTSNSVNFPRIQVSELQQGHRLIHIHHNVSGVLAQIDQVLADHDINIIGQFLKTNDTIGYVITDINKEYSKDVLSALREIEATIKTRVLY